MIVKPFEIRDKGTFIPAMGILMVPADNKLANLIDEVADKERYLLRRAGFDFAEPSVVLVRMECAGTDRNATYDPYSWGERTWQTAHLYIQNHWNELESAVVICVEHILGERETPKESERVT